MSWKNILKDELDFNFNGPNVKKLVEYAEKIRQKGGRAAIEPEWIPDRVAKMALMMIDKLTLNDRDAYSVFGVEDWKDRPEGKRGNTWYIYVDWKHSSNTSKDPSYFYMNLLIEPNEEDLFKMETCRFETQLTVKKPINEMTKEEINKYASMVDWRTY